VEFRFICLSVRDHGLCRIELDNGFRCEGSNSCPTPVAENYLIFR